MKYSKKREELNKVADEIDLEIKEVKGYLIVPKGGRGDTGTFRQTLDEVDTHLEARRVATLF
jgi:hypothetical protein